MKTILLLLAGSVCLLAQPPSTRLVARWTADSLGTADGAAIASITSSVGGVVASQATGGKQPIMKFNVPGFNGHKIMRFRASAASALDITSGFTIADKSTYSVFVVSQPGYVDYAGNATYLHLGTATQAIWYVNNHGEFGYCCDQGDVTLAGTHVPSNVSLIGYTVNGGSMIFYTAESSVTGSSFANTGAMTGGHIGSNGTTYFPNVDIAEVLIYSPAIQSSDLPALRSYVNTTYGTAAARRQIIISGNSLTAGDHLLAGDLTMPEQLALLMRNDVRIYNGGFSGQYIVDMIANDPANVQGLCTTGKDITLIWEGTNELTISSAATAFARTMTLAAQHKAAGCFPVLATTIKSAQLTGALETARTDYNALLMGQNTYIVIDLASLSQFSNTADTTYYYSDGTHLTYASGTVLANAILTVLNDKGTSVVGGIQ